MQFLINLRRCRDCKLVLVSCDLYLKYKLQVAKNGLLVNFSAVSANSFVTADSSQQGTLPWLSGWTEANFIVILFDTKPEKSAWRMPLYFCIDYDYIFDHRGHANDCNVKKGSSGDLIFLIRNFDRNVYNLKFYRICPSKNCQNKQIVEFEDLEQ